MTFPSNRILRLRRATSEASVWETLVIAIIATAGATYAGVITYNYITKETYTDFKENPNYDYSQDMIYQNNFYYKKVMTYEEYEKCKEV